MRRVFPILLGLIASACAGGEDIDSLMIKPAPETSTAGDDGGDDGSTAAPSGSSSNAAMDASGDGGAPAVCGNGAKEGDEECDGLDVGGLDCTDYGFMQGVLACDQDCVAVTEACSSCGDGVVSLTEACDGMSFEGQTCASLGFGGGTLACSADCTTIVTTGCQPLATCGNGVLDAGEQCDGANLGGNSCQSQGFDMGTATCTASCTLDLTGCSNNPLDCIPAGNFCLYSDSDPTGGCCPPGVEGATFGLCAGVVCV